RRQKTEVRIEKSEYRMTFRKQLRPLAPPFLESHSVFCLLNSEFRLPTSEFCLLSPEFRLLSSEFWSTVRHLCRAIFLRDQNNSLSRRDSQSWQVNTIATTWTGW